MKKYPIIFFLIIIAGLSRLSAQSADTTKIKLELKDGSVLMGTVTDEDSVNIQFRMLNGISITVPHTQVRFKFPAQSTTAPDTNKSSRQFSDPNKTRLFLMPTARPIGNGRGYFSAYELFFPTIAFGIGNSISLAGGMSIFPYAQSQLIYFAPKVTVWNDQRSSFALGSLYLGPTNAGEGSSLIYAAGTFGNEKASMTIAARIPTQSDQNNLIVLGGEVQLSNSLKLITENWIFSESALFSFGFRFFGERLAADLGFFRSGNSDSEGFPFFPWLGFAYNFGTPEPSQTVTSKSSDYAPVTYRGRISYNFFTITKDENLKQALQNQGFYNNDYSGGIFSSGSSDNSSGDGVVIQIERQIKDKLFAGITISTIGDVIGTPASFTSSRYDYISYGSFTTEIKIVRSLSTYGVHLAYSSFNNEHERNDQSYSVGVGIGRSTMKMDWEYSYYNYYYGYQRNVGSTSFALSHLTGIAFLEFEQRIGQNFYIGLDGAYFLMPDARIETFQLYKTTYTDNSVNPPQLKTYVMNVKEIMTNFSYGKIGITFGAAF